MQVDIPAKALEALADALDQIAKKHAVDIQGIQPEVATREVFALLSRPHPRLRQLPEQSRV